MYNNFRGGFGGGNMQNLLRQAQKMQEEMEQKQKELEESVFESTVGGGMLKVAMNGKFEIQSIEIKSASISGSSGSITSDFISID